MKHVALVLVFVASAFGQRADPTPTPPVDPKVDFKIALVGKQTEFRIGDIIPIKLSFSSRLRERYQLNAATYDRSGRMEYESFTVTPGDGAVDPLADRGLTIGGGHTPQFFLERKPWTVEINLNEWLRFTKPGEYKLIVSSDRVERVDPAGPYGKSPVRANSNEITLKILPRDPEWEKRTFDQAVATLRGSMSPSEAETPDDRVRYAFETLRFLGTPDATCELVKQLAGPWARQLGGTIQFGIVYSPEREVARDALRAALAEPDRPLDHNFIDTLVDVERRRDGTSEERVLNEIARVLPEKRKAALPVSLYSLVDYSWIRGGKPLLPRETVEPLVQQLLEIFDQLTVAQRMSLLEDRWEEIRNPVLVPFLRQYAQRDPSDFEVDDHDHRRLTAVAIRRWFELDPAGARPAIIREISRAEPRFGLRELGILPDQILPEVDRLLVEHLGRAKGFQTIVNLAALIARYGTREILPEVLQLLDAKIGKWSCRETNPLLAYALRFDPESARPRIAKAVAASNRDERCHEGVFGAIAAIHYDPLLEELAVRALKSNPDTAADATGLLSSFGSPDMAEPLLWQLYEKWCKRIEGRERRLAPRTLESHRGMSDLDVGRSYLHSIAEANRWLTDEPKLQKLMAMTDVPTIRWEIELYLEKWRSKPLGVSVSSCGPRNRRQPEDVGAVNRFSAHVAQYQLDSMEALQEKLSQFPSGRQFKLYRPTDEEEGWCVDEVRAFLEQHEFLVVDAKEDGTAAGTPANGEDL